MSIRLITGKAGEPHITSADIGKFNSLILGEENYVFITGGRLACTKVSDSVVSVADGEGIINGRYFRVEGSERLTITKGTSGRYRQDLIVARYEKDTTSGIESIRLVVIKGTNHTTSPAPIPVYNEGDILNGDLIVDMPIARVALNGTAISGIVSVAKSKKLVDTDVSEIKENIASIDADIESMKVTDAQHDIVLEGHENEIRNLHHRCDEEIQRLDDIQNRFLQLDEVLERAFIVERRGVDFSFDAGTIGSRAYSVSDSIGISGYTPVAVTVGAISNTSRFIPTARLNGTSSVSVNAYRATASASGASEYIYYYVTYIKNGLIAEVEN